ncbi:MAG: cation:proton antiporter [Gammaproteobacteria bacterium]|nr:cation:proton antiporter [Gammaproteobacteria bacterium]
MEHTNTFIFIIFLIFSGAAMLSTIALFTRQSLLVAYIVLGLLLGPWVSGLSSSPDLIEHIGHVGIVFLLYLLGLDLNPKDLWSMLQKASWVAFVSSLIFGAVSFAVAHYFGFSVKDSVVIAIAMMFSSTIIGLKLLPTTVLHHQHTGEIMVSVLLLQDLLVIAVLLLLHGAEEGGLSLKDIGLMSISLPALLLIGFCFERLMIYPLLKRFDRIKEYIFLLALGWCLGMAQIAIFLGLSAEIGAFVAGVTIAVGPVARYIAENLKPLRDFFLVLFFFSIGASLKLPELYLVAVPATVLAVVLLILKPLVFRALYRITGEADDVAAEAGVRLGQASEFSLLLAAMAYSSSPALITSKAFSVIQGATVLTFIVSSYWIVLRYPTPLAFSEKLRRD